MQTRISKIERVQVTTFANLKQPSHSPQNPTDEERRKLIAPVPRGGRRISSSAFLSRRPFSDTISP